MRYSCDYCNKITSNPIRDGHKFFCNESCMQNDYVFWTYLPIYPFLITSQALKTFFKNPKVQSVLISIAALTVTLLLAFYITIKLPSTLTP